MYTIMHVFKLTIVTRVVLVINHPNHCHSAHHFKANERYPRLWSQSIMKEVKVGYKQFSCILIVFVAVTPS